MLAVAKKPARIIARRLTCDENVDNLVDRPARIVKRRKTVAGDNSEQKSISGSTNHTPLRGRHIPPWKEHLI